MNPNKRTTHRQHAPHSQCSLTFRKAPDHFTILQQEQNHLAFHGTVPHSLNKQLWHKTFCDMPQFSESYPILKVEGQPARCPHLLPEGKRLLGRPRHRLVDNIKRVLKTYGGSVNCIQLTWVSDLWKVLVNTVINFQVPYMAGILTS